jgi:hypothetical protein
VDGRKDVLAQWCGSETHVEAGGFSGSAERDLARFPPSGGICRTAVAGRGRHSEISIAEAGQRLGVGGEQQRDGGGDVRGLPESRGAGSCKLFRTFRRWYRLAAADSALAGPSRGGAGFRPSSLFDALDHWFSTTMCERRS